MRVLFLTPSVRLLGARQSLLALARRLPADVEPCVAVPGTGELTEALSEAGVPFEVIPHGAWRKATGRVKAQLVQMPQLRRLHRRFRPDIVHANEFHSVPQAVRAGGRGEMRGSGGRGVTGHVRLGITPRQIANYDMAGCRRIVAVSAACAALFDGSGLEDRVRVVHNGVDVEGLTDGEGGARLRSELGWNVGETLVFCLLGLVSERKNQLVAVEAAVRANQLGAPVRLLLAGNPFKSSVAYGEELKARLQADDARDVVHWLPFQKDVASLYGASDVNLLISSEEGFGRTIIEAGAMGRPSIGSRIGGIPELIDEGRSGWLVGDGDVEGLAKVFAETWRDRDQLPSMGDDARQRVLEHFTLDAHVRRMMEVWEESRA